MAAEDNLSLPTHVRLTAREIQVIRMLANGLRNKEIGDELLISEGTVKAHVHAIYKKLGLTNRVAVALLARNHGLL